MSKNQLQLFCKNERIFVESDLFNGIKMVLLETILFVPVLKAFLGVAEKVSMALWRFIYSVCRRTSMLLFVNDGILKLPVQNIKSFPFGGIFQKLKIDETFACIDFIGLA